MRFNWKWLWLLLRGWGGCNGRYCVRVCQLSTLGLTWHQWFWSRKRAIAYYDSMTTMPGDVASVEDYCWLDHDGRSSVVKRQDQNCCAKEV